MNCPLCHSESKFVFEAKGFPVLDCVACKHRFAEIAESETHVSEIYDDSYFTGEEGGAGAGYAGYLAEGAMLRGRGRDYAKLLSKHTKTGKMLDVGAAAGFVLRGFIDEGWRGAGLEPNETMARFGRENLGLEIFTGSLETFAARERFDLISMIQVAAHFQNPPRAFESAADLLNEGGFLLIETWNRASLTARVFRSRWHEYSPPSVLQWFSEKGLDEFLRQFNFQKIASGRPRKKISGAHAKSLLKYRLGEKSRVNSLLKIIPDKINFPYPAEDLFWALYQKK